MKVEQRCNISPFVEHIFLYLFVTSVELLNPKLLCVVDLILICSMDHVGNAHLHWP